MSTPIELVGVLLATLNRLEAELAAVKQRQRDSAAALLQLETSGNSQDADVQGRIKTARGEQMQLVRQATEAETAMRAALTELESFASADLFHHVSAEVQQIGGRIEAALNGALEKYFEPPSVAAAVRDTKYMITYRNELSRCSRRHSHSPVRDYVRNLLSALDSVAALEKSLP